MMKVNKRGRIILGVFVALAAIGAIQAAIQGSPQTAPTAIAPVETSSPPVTSPGRTAASSSSQPPQEVHTIAKPGTVRATSAGRTTPTTTSALPSGDDVQYAKDQLFILLNNMQNGKWFGTTQNDADTLGADICKDFDITGSPSATMLSWFNVQDQLTGPLTYTLADARSVFAYAVKGYCPEKSKAEAVGLARVQPTG